MDGKENRDAESSQKKSHDLGSRLHRSTNGKEHGRGTRHDGSQESQALENSHCSGSTIETPNTTPISISDITTYREEAGPRRISLQIKKLCTNSVVSSSLFPRPEALSLKLSYGGRWVLAVNSSRIVLFSVHDMSIPNAKAFAVRHRPIAFDIHDNGSLLVVLTRSHQVSVYHLSSGGDKSVHFVRAINLDLPCKNLVISPDGMLFAAIHESGDGLEFVSLSSNRTTTDHRLVTCKGVDVGSFSMDSRTFVGTSTSTESGLTTTTIFTVHRPEEPFTISEGAESENSDKAWIRTLLFPQVVDCISHASIVPDPNTRYIDELLAYRHDLDELAITDIKLGLLATKTFILQHPKIPDRKYAMSALTPAVSLNGDRIAIVVQNHKDLEIWVYELPMAQHQEGKDSMPPSPGQINTSKRPLEPIWRISLSTTDFFSIESISDIRWIDYTSIHDPINPSTQLAAVGRCVNVDNLAHDVATKPVAPEASIIIINFDAEAEAIFSDALQLESIATVDILPTQELGLEQEIELVRRRTTVQKKLPTHTSTRRRGTNSHRNTDRIPFTQSLSHPGHVANGTTGIDEPYSHSQPRPLSSLHRAATGATAAPPQRRHLRALPGYHLEYRRADGRSDAFVPHESDADNWVPPPPPYTPEPDTQSGISRVAASPMNLQVPASISVPAQTPEMEASRVNTHRHIAHPSNNTVVAPSLRTGPTLRSRSAAYQPISPATSPRSPNSVNASSERSLYEENSSRFFQPNARSHLTAFSAEDLRLPPDIDSSSLQRPFGATQRDLQRIDSWRSRNSQSNRPLFLRRSQVYSTDSDVRLPRRYSLQNDDVDNNTRSKVSNVLKSSCVLM